jgi:hypothetical protein
MGCRLVCADQSGGLLAGALALGSELIVARALQVVFQLLKPRLCIAAAKSMRFLSHEHETVKAWSKSVSWLDGAGHRSSPDTVQLESAFRGTASGPIHSAVFASAACPSGFEGAEGRPR